MKFQELIILLPCHSLEDFPLYHEKEEAEGLLAAWSSLWHPAFLASAGELPTWYRADSPPEELADRFMTVPEASESLLLAGWAARAKNEGACVVRKKKTRAEMVQVGLDALDGGDGGVNPDLAADFLALGFVYLQLELLVRQLHHYSNLDEIHLKNETIAAAQAAMEKDDEKARTHLQNCFDVLCEAREQCYPAEAYFIDYCLLADTTLGSGLEAKLAQKQPINFLVSGAVLEKIASETPALLEQLNARLEAGTASVLGGELEESDLPMLSPETILHLLKQGRETYAKHLAKPPSVYARRRAGLTPVLPMILTRLGYTGAAHFTLDDGHFPRSDQSKSRWESDDGSIIDVLARVPVQANDPATFLNLTEKLGESMDLDHVATMTFAHWPGDTCCWYDDLRRMSAYAPVLGQFVQLDYYFRETGTPGEVHRFRPDDYRTPYLKQAIIRRQPGPTTSYHDYTTLRQQLEAAQVLLAIAGTLTQQVPSAELTQQNAELLKEVDESAGPSRPTSESDHRQAVAEHLQQVAAGFAEKLPRKEGSTDAGALVINPLPFARRIGVELTGWSHAPEAKGFIYAAQELENSVAVVLEIPAYGYVWLSEPPHGPSGKRLPKPLVEENYLRNEFFEAYIDPKTGGVQSVRDYQHRDNRLSQQVSYRLPGPRPKPGDVWQDPDLNAIYSSMVAEEVKVTANGAALGEITSRGKIIGADGEELAKFTQRTRVWLGCRELEIDLTLEPEIPAKSDPWNSYYAARFAWNDDAASLSRSAHLGRYSTDAKRLEAPLFVEARSGDQRNLFLTGGLPFSRRIGMRMLDVLLNVRGDTQSQYRLGIGIDAAHPLQAAYNRMVPPIVLAQSPGIPATGPTGWFFHLSRKNVIATSWSLLSSGEKVTGVRVRLLETEGRSGQITLRCLRDPVSARQVDFLGTPLEELKPEGDSISLELKEHEWTELEIYFEQSEDV